MREASEIVVYYGETAEDYQPSDIFKLFIEFSKDCASSLKNIIL